MEFTEEQLKRYSRQIVLPEVGGEGQAKISRAKVFIVGAGGLGLPVGYYLTAAGIGTITIADNDNVELSNLQRQIAHNVNNIGMPKVESAKKAFTSLNPDVNVLTIKQRVTKHNVLGLIREHDIVVDCSDNFPTRFLINDACVMAKKRLVTGAVSKFEGHVTTILPGEGPCYRCLFEEPPPRNLHSPEETGPLGVVPGVIGVLQATEVLKLVLGLGETLKGELLIYDAMKSSFRKVKVPKNPECPICGEHPTIKELIDYSERYCTV